MQKKTWPITVFTFVFGAFAMFLRWLQISGIADAETGLLKRGSALSAVVIIVDILAAALILIYTLSLRGSVKKEQLPMYPVYRNILQPVVAALGCVLLIIGSAILLIKGAGAQKVTGALLLVSAAALAKISINSGKNRALLSVLSSIPALAVCVLLVVEYRAISRQPQLWLYAPRILAYAASALGFYYIAGFPFGRAKPLRALFVTQLAGFLCLAAMGDSGQMPGGALILAAFAAMFILASWAILSSATITKRGHKA